MEIELTSADGITLKTKDKYCSEDIDITPKLQTKAVTTNGSVVADDGYCGLSAVEVNVAQMPAQPKTVDLAMADGDQTIPPDSGKTLSSVTVIKPSTMLPANIKKGVNIGGVVGTLEGGIDVSDTTATAADVRVGKDFYAADGTKTQGTIADYDGSFTGAGSRSNLNIHYGDTAPTDTSKLWIKSTEPESIEFIQDPEQTQELNILDTTLQTTVSSISAAAVGTKIYLFGGHSPMGNIIQEFDTETKTITTLSATLPIVTTLIGAAAVGTKIYLFGGYSLKSFGASPTYLNTIQEFDTETKTITTLSITLPTGTYGISAVAIGTKIYLFGGRCSTWLNTIQEFDSETKTITTLSATLPTAAAYIGTAAIGTKIYLFGGEGDIYLNTIQEFIVSLVLTSGNILGQQSYDKNIFTLVPPPTKVTIGLKNVYKGNSNNIAEFVDAYLYNGTNWVNVNTGETA